jgi:hypothetical protein
MNSTVTEVKPKTSEQVRADKRKRVIANAGKAAKRTSPKLASPLPKAHTPKAAVSNLSPAMPGFNEQTKAKFDLAVRALKGTRSLSERLTIAACHLRSDPTLSAIDPRELWREVSFQNQ